MPEPRGRIPMPRCRGGPQKMNVVRSGHEKVFVEREEK